MALTAKSRFRCARLSNLLQQFELPIDTIDERYTSLEAERVLKEARAAGTRGRLTKEMVDAAAAVFIAERYLAAL